ncbi:ROK family protein [Microbacterium sp. RURRCA19A]|uniref:ROK family protein n=1 Tax=Microbacterium sp. RURRCA19A TaxID=1907391 RepID=UPI000954BF02|nr:ROK family protein [Microbacterium sp. RURRCA19A]SIR96880.1 glucokinase [Microbacterium sp. RURRCA19A]
MTASVLGPGPAVAAVDIGGTAIKLALVDAEGRPGPVLRIPTPRAEPEHIALAVLRAAADGLRTLSGFATVTSVGIGAPGLVDDSGHAVFSENLGWRDAPLARLAADELSLPVTVVHDVRAAGEAERRLGAGRGLTDVAVVTVGTGIASAVFVGGVAHTAGGYAGEIGHAVVRPGGEPCVCGNRGCLEATASSAALARRYAARTGTPVSGSADVLRRARQGDPVAGELWDDAVDALGLGLSHVAALLAPEAIIVGGGLAQAGDDLFVPLQQRLDDYHRLRPVPLLPARLGEDAGVLGAALAARDAGERA